MYLFCDACFVHCYIVRICNESERALTDLENQSFWKVLYVSYWREHFLFPSLLLVKMTNFYTSPYTRHSQTWMRRRCSWTARTSASTPSHTTSGQQWRGDRSKPVLQSGPVMAAPQRLFYRKRLKTFSGYRVISSVVELAFFAGAGAG